jgi:8-amino-7-oxononanoate synthase
MQPPTSAVHPSLADPRPNPVADDLHRVLRTLPGVGGRIERDGRTVLNLSSNDYLNLAGDPRLKAAAVGGIEKYGCGATASRLMSGHLDLHEELEAALARLTGREAALVFGSGFLTNLGALTTLAGRGDAIFADRLNHASLVDGARLSGARLHRYRHADAEHLETLLAGETRARRRIVVTDSVFSMDGDLAPLEAIAAVARRHGALIVVDEAHAIGVFGERGAGLCRQLADELQPDIVVGTLGKALGGYGGFVACSAAIRETLIDRARAFIYSTALPPSVVASALAAARIVMDEPNLGPQLLERAERFIVQLRRALGPDEPDPETPNSKLEFPNPKSGILTPELFSAFRIPHSAFPSPIIPLMVGGNRESVALMEKLLEKNVFAVAVRPPTVPAGTARLRLSVTLAHGEDDLARAADAIADAAREMRLP